MSSDVVQVVNGDGGSSVVLICEHASAHIPDAFDHLGLPEDLRQSHAVWDPGAMAVATHMSGLLDAPLVAGGVSRLVYDCNRPPGAPDAMPAKSEVIAVPGNVGLTQAQRAGRTSTYYTPFRSAVAGQVAAQDHPVIVTLHSFTPLYHGAQRLTEIGVLHDADTRLADAMLVTAGHHTKMRVARNDPYGPQDGVTHTLKEHGAGHLNVMLEVRNDLIATPDTQRAMARMIAVWLVEASARAGAKGGVTCTA